GLQHSRRRRPHLHRDLVGLQVQQHIVALDVLTILLPPRGDHAAGHRLADVGDDDGRAHAGCVHPGRAWPGGAGDQHYARAWALGAALGAESALPPPSGIGPIAPATTCSCWALWVCLEPTAGVALVSRPMYVTRGYPSW